MSFRILRTVPQSSIPPQIHRGGAGGGRVGNGIFARLRDRLRALPAGQALKLRHDLPASQMVTARLQRGLSLHGIRFVARVRGKFVYLWRKDIAG